MRHRWLAAALLLALALGSTPAAAEVVDVDPRKDAITTLDPAESQRLATLQHTVYPYLDSEISPDDTTLVHVLLKPGDEDPDFSFLNITDGTITPINRLVRELSPFGELRWRDGRTLVYVSYAPELGPVLVTVDRVTGRVRTQPIRFKGFPVSLAPNGSRLLVAFVKNNDEENPEDASLGFTSPFRITIKHAFDSHYGVARFDAERQALQVSETEVQISVIDLATGESTLLLSLPDGSGLTSPPAWTPDGAKLALGHTTIPKISRRGTELGEKTTQDTLGNLAPADNPFLQNNVVDVFDFPNHDLRPGALKAKDGNGDIFGRLAWSTDGQTLLAQMQHPAKLSGR